MQIGKFNTKENLFIIAELSTNHNGSKQLALDTIYAAKEAGADAIKLQTYRPEWMTIKVDRDEFKAGDLWKNEYLYDLYERAMTPLEWHEDLFRYARSLDLEVFSSPFSKEAVDFLEEFDPPAYKIASFEITDYDLIEYTAKKGKPIIISTGVATLQEIEDVVKICKKVENHNIALLKCTSAYPAPLKDANLKTLVDMQERFNVEVGFSDHTLGIVAPVVAVSLGARIIEKHFILDKNIKTPDREFSLDKKEFKEMVKALRDAQKLLGEVEYRPSEGRKFSRSLYVVQDIKKGEKFTEENIKSIRPGYGLHPKYLKDMLGKEAQKDYSYGDRLQTLS